MKPTVDPTLSFALPRTVAISVEQRCDKDADFKGSNRTVANHGERV
jgi:hypothetical protein